jgi:hypothetical protein
VGLTHCRGLDIVGSGTGFRQDSHRIRTGFQYELGRGQSEAWASPTIAHRSNFGIQLFSIKAPNGIPILSRFFSGLTHCRSLDSVGSGAGFRQDSHRIQTGFRQDSDMNEEGANPKPGPRPPLHIDPTSGSNFVRLRRPMGFQS